MLPQSLSLRGNLSKKKAAPARVPLDSGVTLLWVLLLLVLEVRLDRLLGER
jgi:hypothetical protein